MPRTFAGLLLGFAAFAYLLGTTTHLQALYLIHPSSPLLSSLCDPPASLYISCCCCRFFFATLDFGAKAQTMRKIDRVTIVFSLTRKDVATTNQPAAEPKTATTATIIKRTTAKTHNGHKTKSLTDSPQPKKGVHSILKHRIRVRTRTWT